MPQRAVRPIGAVGDRFRVRVASLGSSLGVPTAPFRRRLVEMGRVMLTLLWILAVVLVIAGIVAIVRGQLLWGIVLIIVGLLVGPGGVSIFNK
jgi:hypothetical protein